MRAKWCSSDQPFSRYEMGVFWAVLGVFWENSPARLRSPARFVIRTPKLTKKIGPENPLKSWHLVSFSRWSNIDLGAKVRHPRDTKLDMLQWRFIHFGEILHSELVIAFSTSATATPIDRDKFMHKIFKHWSHIPGPTNRLNTSHS